MIRFSYYWNLLINDRKAFRHQLWMVYNRYRITSIQWFFRTASKMIGDFITVHSRPIFSSKVGTWSDKPLAIPRIAIIMQGPLMDEFDFTLETVRIYKKHFVDAKIIVSVFEGSNKDLLDRLAKEGAHIVTCKKPSVAGIGNINMQLVTTMAGLKIAKEMGAEYVYKTRTDQRMYATSLNEYLLNLLEIFPAKGGYKQTKRIVASGFGSLKYAPYLLADVWGFGQINDMLAYWGLELENRPPLSKPAASVRDLVEANINEAHICSEYLKKIGRDTKWTLADWWQALADNFVIVDNASLDLFFYKYDFYKEYRQFTYEGNAMSQLLTFKDWFNIYANLKNKKSISEDIINLPRRDSIIPEKYGN